MEKEIIPLGEDSEAPPSEFEDGASERFAVTLLAGQGGGRARQRERER